MPSAMVLALVLTIQAPRPSVLGKDRPWWEKIGPGDVVRLRPIPGTAEPMVRIWTGLDEDGGPRRTDVYAALFAAAIRDGDRGAIHRMLDRSDMEGSFGASAVQVVSVARGPGPAMAEVVALSHVDAAGVVREHPVPVADTSEPSLRSRSYLMPVASLAPEGATPHPDRDRIPALVRKSPDLWKGGCRAEGCRRIAVVPYAEARRSWEERRRRAEAIVRKGRRAAAGR